MLPETLEKVRRRWLDDGCEPVPPLDDTRLKERFSELQIHPTRELLEVFSFLNGFVNHRMDRECFQFWSIDRMLEENNRYHANDGSFCHFADYLINSHTYAFSQNETDFVSVYCYYCDDYIVKVADSFEEFFDWYLTEPMKLYPN